MNMMDVNEKVAFYERKRLIIHTIIKTDETTKPLWRKLFWSTGRNSKEYKAGCVDIFKEHFKNLFDYCMRA